MKYETDIEHCAILTCSTLDFCVFFFIPLWQDRVFLFSFGLIFQFVGFFVVFKHSFGDF